MRTIMVVLLFLAFMTAWYLIQTHREFYLENEPTVVKIRNKLLPVFPEIKFVKMLKGTSSYTINKQKIYLCTETKGQVYDDNMLIYVTLHELAHTMCPEIGHGKQFHSIFQSLLDRAERHGLFDPKKPRVENYCKI